MIKDGIPHLQDENSVCDDEKATKVENPQQNMDEKVLQSDRKRRHTKDDHKVKEPAKKVQKYSKNPDVQVGTVRTLRNRTFAVPAVQPLSEALKSNSSRVQRAAKKPKGKGYSKGNYGEETVICRDPKTSFSNTCQDNFGIPDLVGVDEAAKLNHPGLTSNRSKPSNVNLNSSSDDESLNFLEDGILASKSGGITIGAQIANESKKKQYRKRSNVGRKSETAKSSSKNR